MKMFFRLLSICLCVGAMAACTSNTREEEFSRRKIYLTQEDYLEDLTEEAAKERREAPGAEESDYIFNVRPLVSDNVYFFDERQQPKVPGQPAVSEYKKEKRLWTKPRRYAPDEYYGPEESSSSSGGKKSSSSSYEESYSSAYY